VLGYAPEEDLDKIVAENFLAKEQLVSIFENEQPVRILVVHRFDQENPDFVHEHPAVPHSQVLANQLIENALIFFRRVGEADHRAKGIALVPKLLVRRNAACFFVSLVAEALWLICILEQFVAAQSERLTRGRTHKGPTVTHDTAQETVVVQRLHSFGFLLADQAVFAHLRRDVHANGFHVLLHSADD